MRESQNQFLLKKLKSHLFITQRMALNWGIYRLASRIHDLRKAGYPIQSSVGTVKTRWGKTKISIYYLKEE